MLAILGLIFGLVAFVASILILIHAFQASVGQGLLCLCIPFYIVYYAFARFEHEKKQPILIGFLGGWILAIAANFGSVMASFSSM